jgi:hypothetical protein
MALDTYAKRASAVGVRLPWRAPPIPSGTFNAAQRMFAAGMYSGIASVIEVGPITVHTPSERMVYVPFEDRTVIA